MKLYRHIRIRSLKLGNDSLLQDTEWLLSWKASAVLAAGDDGLEQRSEAFLQRGDTARCAHALAQPTLVQHLAYFQHLDQAVQERWCNPKHAVQNGLFLDEPVALQCVGELEDGLQRAQLVLIKEVGDAHLQLFQVLGAWPRRQKSCFLVVQ